MSAPRWIVEIDGERYTAMWAADELNRRSGAVKRDRGPRRCRGRHPPVSRMTPWSKRNDCARLSPFQRRSGGSAMTLGMVSGRVITGS